MEVKFKSHSFGKGLKVNHRCKVGKNLILGNNVNFNGIKVKGGAKVIIGDNFHSGTEILIIPRFHNYDSGKAIPYDNTFIERNVIIGDNVWLGDRVIILGGVTIGEGAIIQAGAVVVKSIPKYGIAGGNPAKIFKERDIDHYERLKYQQKFH